MNNQSINSQQFELAAKYLDDVSKGSLLAGFAGLAMGKMTIGWFTLTVIFSFLSYLAAFQIEGLD